MDNGKESYKISIFFLQKSKLTLKETWSLRRIKQIHIEILYDIEMIQCKKAKKERPKTHVLKYQFLLSDFYLINYSELSVNYNWTFRGKIT